MESWFDGIVRLGDIMHIDRKASYPSREGLFFFQTQTARKIRGGVQVFDLPRLEEYSSQRQGRLILNVP